MNKIFAKNISDDFSNKKKQIFQDIKQSNRE